MQGVLRRRQISAVVAVDEELLPPVEEDLSEGGAVARLAQLAVEARVDLGQLLDPEEDARPELRAHVFS